MIILSSRYLNLLLILALLFCGRSNFARETPSLKMGYPTMDGRFAVAAQWIGKNENFIKIIDINNPVPENAEYVQCMDPVFYDRPVLIGKSKSIWQFTTNLNSVDLYMHTSGNLTQTTINFGNDEKIGRTEIVADAKQNYLIVFLRDEKKMKGIKVISIDGNREHVCDWISFSNCEICSNGDWKASDRWFRVISSQDGPVFVWCDFQDPPKFNSLFVVISQFDGIIWSDQLILDTEYADMTPFGYSSGYEIVVSWFSAEAGNPARLMVTMLGKKLLTKETWELPRPDLEGPYMRLAARHCPYLYKDKPVVFFTAYNHSESRYTISGYKRKNEEWIDLGVIAKVTNQPTIFPFTAADGELSIVIYGENETLISSLKDGNWRTRKELSQSVYYLKTIGECITMNDGLFVLPDYLTGK